MNWLLARYRVSADPLFSERRVELAALVLTALLCLLFLYSVARLTLLSEPDPIALSSEALLASELVAVATVDEEQRQEVRARPVFWQSRRPKEAPSEAVSDKPKAAVGAIAKVKLLGVIGAGESAGVIALVDDKRQRTYLGQEILGWTLDSVGLDRAVFSYSGRQHELKLVHAGETGSGKIQYKKSNNGALR
ncbi:MAG: type II secretion system protein N [Halioglobus sp.]